MEIERELTDSTIDFDTRLVGREGCGTAARAPVPQWELGLPRKI